MAITAVITITDSSLSPEQRATATCTITNSGSTSVNVLSVVPYAVPVNGSMRTTAMALGMPPLGPGMTVAVAGSSGTLAVPFDVIAHAPQPGGGLGNPATLRLDIGATVSTSDGSVVAATVQTVDVAADTH